MTDQIEEKPKKKSTTKSASAKTVLKVEGKEVVATVVPEDVIEIESEEGEGKATVKFGESVYEHAGKCLDCSQKRPPVDTDVFKWVSGPRVDHQLGDQLAAYRREGHTSAPLCKACYDAWLGKQPKREKRYKVLTE